MSLTSEQLGLVIDHVRKYLTNILDAKMMPESQQKVLSEEAWDLLLSDYWRWSQRDQRRYQAELIRKNRVSIQQLESMMSGCSGTAKGVSLNDAKQKLEEENKQMETSLKGLIEQYFVDRLFEKVIA